MPTIKKSLLLIGLGVLSVMAVLLYFSFNPDQGLLFPKCPSYQFLGIYCPGCGSQRAVHDLLHLRIGDAVAHNILLLPGLFVLAQHGLVKTGFLKSQSFLNYRYAPIIVLIIVVLFMFLRNLEMYPFEYLAP